MVNKIKLSKKISLFALAIALSIVGLMGKTVHAACAVPPGGMVSWRPGEGNAKDIVIVTGNKGTLQGGATFGPGMVDQTFIFDGVNDYVAVSPVGYPDITNNFTIEFWAYPTATHGIDTESTSGTSGASGQRYAIYPQNGAQVIMAVVVMQGPGYLLAQMG